MAYVANPQDQQHLEWMHGSTVRMLIDKDVTGGSLAGWWTRLSEGDGAPLHVHAREEEVFVLLSGTATVWAGDERYELTEGGVAYLSRDVPHTYRITSPNAELLTLVTPAGLEDFFRAAGHDRALPKPADWSIGPATLSPAAAAHGVTLLGPPPHG